jgi:hypothetical protein
LKKRVKTRYKQVRRSIFPVVPRFIFVTPNLILSKV